MQWRESAIFKVSVANAFGAIGSLLAGVLAFKLGSLYQSQFTRVVLAKCVASIATTHIGGSINFFQVARAVGLDQEGQGLLGAVAGADIFLMALYFAGLLGMQRSPAGTAAFLSGTSASGGQAQGQGGGATAALGGPPRARGRYSDPSPAVIHMAAGSSTSSNKRKNGGFGAAVLRLGPPLLALGLAFAIGEGGQLIETQVGIPGTSAGTITLLSIGIFGLLRRVAPRFFLSVAHPAGALSAFLFSLFFAAIGAGASLTHLVASGPVIVTLMTLSLMIHLSTTLLTLRAYNHFVPPRAKVGVDEMLIASNANIGGPATAAAMAGSIGRADLVLPAAATGVAGYALATFLGVGLFKMLLKG
jgi:uncharacterized membrane protein